MLRKMILLSALVVLTIGCQHKFNWESHPYAADHLTETIHDKDGNQIKCMEQAFDDYICFHYDNIAELKAEIERINRVISRKKIKLRKNTSIYEDTKISEKFSLNIINQTPRIIFVFLAFH